MSSHRSHRGRFARVSTSVLFALTLWIALAGTAAAQTFTLSGTVTGGGSPIAGATVEALTNGTTTVAGTSTTNGSGQFSIALPPAIYDLRVTPPAASGFNSEVLQDVDLTASNQQVDIILLSGAAGGIISGTVRGLGGAPIPSASVTIASSSTGQSLSNGTTDANGFYSLPAATTSARVTVSRNGPAPTTPSGTWSVQRFNLPVGSGVTYDVILPAVTLSGQVTDSGGNPVPSATIQASTNTSDADRFWSYSATATADASGNYSMTVFTGTSTFLVRPPTGSPLPLLSQNVSIVADTVRNFALPAASSLNGVVRGLGGQPVPGVSLSARSATTNALLTSVITSADGTYVLNVPAGAINLTLGRSSAPTTLVPTSFSLSRNNIAVSGATVLDIDLPVVSVAGTTTDPASVPIANAFISADSSGFDAQANWSSSFTVSSGAGGIYSLLLFKGTANFFVRPPVGMTSVAPLVDRGVSLTANVTRDFVLPTAMTLGGIVRGIGGQPLQGVSVAARHSSGVSLVSGTTDVNGSYSLAVPAGTLSDVTFTRGSSSTTLAPSNWSFRRFNVAINGPTTLDVSLSVIRLNGSALDSNGSPVANVNIIPSTSRFQTGGDLTEWFSNPSIFTSSNGSYSLLLLTGTGNVTIRPTAASGFSQVTLSPVTFANNFTQRIVLQRPDTTPPVIVSGPGVLHLSDSSVSIGWTTNEPSTSIVDYGIGDLSQQAGSNALTTQHTVTLLNLAPNEIYSFRVSSRDRNNNGPAQSGTGFFTMLAPPGDVTPPAITAGPLPSFLGDTAAILQWLTNEPASSVVRYGATPSFGNEIASGAGEFLALHSVVLPGLTPSTQYFAQVESTDPDGNTTVSSTFTFTTAAAPDIQAPVITSAPEVSSRTQNSATIRWTTDEAATSGVSYNDGSAFNVASDDTLTTIHEVILAGLSPSKSYSFTVASRDAGGNGPTLAGPFTFTTLAAPDATAPTVSAVAVTPTKNTASIAWTTDEPATSEVRFGVNPSALDRVVTDLTRVTSHQMTLTDLAPATTYYFVVRSFDASGNAGTFAETFTTLPEDVNTPPTAPSPVTVSPNPTNTGSFTITWGASTDDGPGGVKEYVVYLAGVAIQTLPPTITSYTASGVGEGSYFYNIGARDFSDATSISAGVTVVVDLTPPSLNLPAPIATPATTNTDAIVNYTVTAADSRDPNPSVSCSPASGSAFPIGMTTVPCTARDSAGNVTTGSFTVTVTDPFPPVLTVPAGITVQADNQNGAIVNFTATAVDNHDPSPTVTCSPASGSLFPVGLTLTVCTATDASGNSATRSFNVSVGAPAKVASSTSVSVSPAAPHYGEPVSWTAAVNGTNGSTPTGSVQFFDGDIMVGQGVLTAPSEPGAAATATVMFTTMSDVGTRVIKATYLGDAGHEGSTSEPLNVEVVKGTLTIEIGVPPGDVTYSGAPLALKISSTGKVGSGLLTVTYNGSPDRPVDVGTYTVLVSFAGDDHYEPTSATATVRIVPGPTQTVVQPGAAIVFGQQAVITATVTSPTGQAPQGSVEFFDGATTLGAATLNPAGTAQFTAASLGAGTHTLTAAYTGAGNFAGSASAGAAFEVSRASTATSLTVAPNPAGLLQAFRLTATVAVLAPGAGVPAGVVEFFAGTTSLGTGTLTLVGGVPTAIAAMNGFPAGTYPITARYTGTASFAASTSDVVNQVVRGAESSTWTALTVSPAGSSRANTNVTLRAAVVPLGGTVQPTGLVQFYAWSSPIGAPVALANVSGTMTATLVTPVLPSGLLQLRAVYLGAPGFSTSVSAPVSHTVYTTTVPFATATAMTLSANPIAFGTALTATVAVASGTRPTPGYFLLFVDNVPTQALPVVSGSPATFTIPSLGLGMHAIAVQFVPSTTSLAGSLANQYVFVQ